MNKPSQPSSSPAKAATARDARARRLAQALKANLRRRKDQARLRAEGDAKDSRDNKE